jgi:tetratricopeptide (TPR) repeat protein
MNLIKNKFTSKEIDFLKRNSKNESNKAIKTKPPEVYLSDILKNETNEINAFKKRLQDTNLSAEKFICAIFRVSYTKKKQNKNTDTLLEETFQTVFPKGKGLWQRIDKGLYALAFWTYNDKNTAKNILESLKHKMSSAMNIDICIGASWYPFEDYSKFDAFDNAVKALDHAAFFGKDATMFFDGVSIHIYGDRLYQLGYIEEASIEYQKGLELDKSNITLINSLGVCYGLIDMLDKAKDEFKRVLKISPNEIMSIYNLGLAYDLTDDTEKALKYLRKANSIDNNIFEIELLLGSMLHKKNESKKAFYNIKKALKLNSESSQALRIIGEIFLERKKLVEAVSNFSKAIKIDPSDAISLSGLAKAYEMQNKNIDIALSFAKKSVMLDPDNPTFRTRLGEIYLKKENHELAKKEFDIASSKGWNDQKAKSA